MPDPYRLDLNVVGAFDSAAEAGELLEVIQKALPPNALLEVGAVEPMDHRDVVDDSPLARLLYDA